MNVDKIRVAVVGLEFGAGFVGPLLAHPNVAAVGLCDINPTTLAEAGKRFGIDRLHGELAQVVEDSDYDAVCLFTAIPDHAAQAVAVMQAGKHVASAVPMATTLDDLRKIIACQKATGRNYMMMETAVYSPEFLFAQEANDRGEFGRIQFLRGYWYNNLENHPRYWWGLPPMHYITHPMSPILSLAKTRAESVVCLGSGSMRPQLTEVHKNPWPIEVALFRLAGSPALVEIASLTIETSLQCKETFDLYGDRQSFKSATFWGDRHALVRTAPPRPDGPKWAPTTLLRLELPATTDRLPRPLRQFGPHSAEPHLVHEFVTSIVEARPPAINAVTAANWTAPGLCAHQSAMNNGAMVEIPAFA
jgi:predicted dehydrogenase